MSHRSLLLSLFLALATLLACAPAAAQGADDARIDRLLEITRAQQMLEGMLPQVEASQQQMLAQLTAGHPLDADRQARLQRIQAASNAAIRQSLSWDNLEPVYRSLYRETFSSEDIDGMIVFYESPTGQRMLDKMPLLMQNTMAAVQRLVVPMLQQLERDIASELASDAP